MKILEFSKNGIDYSLDLTTGALQSSTVVPDSIMENLIVPISQMSHYNATVDERRDAFMDGCMVCKRALVSKGFLDAANFIGDPTKFSWYDEAVYNVN